MHTWTNIERSYNDSEFKISTPTGNYKFELPNELFSVSDIQDYFESAIKKDETFITHKQESVLKELKIEFHLKLRLVLI